MKNFYETQKIVWVNHEPYFFPERNAQRFDVYDETGMLGFCYVAPQPRNGKGWYSRSNDEDGERGPFGTRAEALRAMLGECESPKGNRIVEPDMSGKIIYEREIVLVQPFPLQGARLRLNEGGGRPPLSPWTSVACAIVQTNPSGQAHAILSTDDPGASFRPVEAADNLGLLPEDRTVVDFETFHTLISAYTASVNNVDNLRALCVLLEKHAPAMRFVPAHLVPALKDGDRFIARMFLRHDLSKYQAIARFGPEEYQQPKKTFLDALGITVGEDCDHIISGWYAFNDIDKAVEMKIRAPADSGVVIHPVSYEYV